MNGGAEVSAASGNTSDLTGLVHVGKNGTSAAFFDGEIAEVIVCNFGDLYLKNHWDALLGLADRYGISSVSTR